ncbi:hypothetical protein J2R95_003139 [Bradyrhizobium japonicum]|jgi:hypothetical protein|nr:hypothetical protein [Bradyrhizobium japonicum]
MWEYDNYSLDGDFVHYGLVSLPSWSTWLIPGTELED